ncbi:MAG TPA: hypothetical protein VIU63_01270, partial [Nitrospira sp.]
MKNSVHTAGGQGDTRNLPPDNRASDVDRNIKPVPAGMPEGNESIFLGWLRIGLGLAELAIPHRVAGFVGIHSSYYKFIRLVGLREIATGVALLS